MLILDMLPWQMLERRRASAFVASGILWLGDATLLGLELLEIYAHGLLNGLFIITAMLAAMLGLLGFVPRLSERAPRLARVSAVVAAVAVAGLAVALVWHLGAIVSAGLSFPPGVGAVPAILALALFGVAGLWTDDPSRAVGLLLLGLAAPWVTVFVVALVGPPGWLESAPQWSLPVVISALAVLSLAIGYVVRAGRSPLPHAEPSTDSTA